MPLEGDVFTAQSGNCPALGNGAYAGQQMQDMQGEWQGPAPF